jgi:hypothetical protein
VAKPSPPKEAQFKPGQSGNPVGRPPVKKVRRAIRHMSGAAIAGLETGVLAGEQWAVTLWFHYFYGKPVETQRLQGPDGGSLVVEIRKLTDKEDSKDA